MIQQLKDKQIKQIKANALLIDNALKALDEQKNNKQELILANEKIKLNLDKENLTQGKMIVEIRNDEKRFANQIRIKQNQADEIDKKIEKIMSIKKRKNFHISLKQLSQ